MLCEMMSCSDVFTLLAFSALVLAAVPAFLFLCNLFFYTAPPHVTPSAVTAGALPRVSILIPARDEQRSIEASVRAALASRGVDHEVIVLDDHSKDKTAEIVRAMAAEDSRLRLEFAPPLPEGWCGKQFACSVLAKLATHPVLCFLDADVRLAPDGLARAAAFLERSGAPLVSGFPHQELGTFYERLLLPLMHFVLLGYLPFAFMRQTTNPAFSAGCGQFFVAAAGAYFEAGGHAAIRNSRHDGIQLPKAFRRAGFQTDLCDATSIATCRMYQSRAEVFAGLLKNATEGIASPVRISIFTPLLVGGEILPVALLLHGLYHHVAAIALVSGVATGLSYLPRLIAAARFRQPFLAALLHPFAIAVFLSIQWYALIRQQLGVPAVWKGRSYQAT